MEDIQGLVQGLADKAPWVVLVLGSLGGLSVLAQMIVALTPSPKDDMWLEKPWLKAILEFLERFAPYKKK